MGENPTFQIPRDVIEPIIQAHIASAVAGSLAGRATLVTEIVTQFLNAKVDSDGKPSSYDRGLTFIQWAMNDALRKAVRDILSAELAKHEQAIRENIAAQLSQKKSPLMKQLIESLMTGVINASTSQYRMSITVEEYK